MLSLIKLCLESQVFPNLPEGVRLAFEKLLSFFNPYKHFVQGKPLGDVLEKSLPELEARLKELWVRTDPMEFEIAI